MRKNLVRKVAAGIGAAALTATFSVAAMTPAAAQGTEASTDQGDLPAPGSSDARWEAWAAEDRATIEATDWAAASAGRGCELVELEIVTEVDAAYNASVGAPADLATARADMVEDCDNPTAESLAKKAGANGLLATDVSTTAIGSGSTCATTHGPGTICISKSSGIVYNSWRYDGSGSVSGFLRIYKIPTSSSSCYRGSTWLTGSDMTWSSGMTRSIGKTRAGYSGYSAHIWKKVTIGHTDWGRACAKL
ncbi:hypothetical protein ACNHYB_10575 [Isoptericola jiangsuensis]|uniref:hypothetical protein n=1 Tax=Isoptericola jiangsuensis TaxID=548579 RepID=UPI003AAFE371